MTGDRAVIVWDGMNLIGLAILGVFVGLCVLALCIILVKCGVDRVIERMRREEKRPNDDEDTHS